MVILLAVGSRVKVKAMHFDENSHHEWSRHEFGDEWELAFCKGTVESVSRNSRFCRVHWDSDESVMRVLCHLVETITESDEEMQKIRNTAPLLTNLSQGSRK